MSPGKLAAQAGHAYTDALLDALARQPETVAQYRNPAQGGAKVTLATHRLSALLRAYRQAMALALPCAIIVDQHHVHPPHFDGSPIITALGLGPVTRAQARVITRRFSCLK